MQIEYNERIKKFVVRCSFVENSLIADLPNKRFQRRTGVWHVPPLSRNSEILLDRLQEYMSKEALEVAKSSVRRVQVRHQPFPSWYEFRTQPFKHQREALDFGWGLERYAYFMEMGTGKTKIEIDMNSARFMQGSIDTWVVFCPVSVRDNWIEEIGIHSPLDDIPVFMVGDLTKARIARMVRDADRAERFIAVVGIESLQSRFRGGSAFDTLVNMIGGRKYSVTVDESHLGKGHTSNRARNLELLTWGARFASIMTGTPLDKGLLDLYMQFQILDPNIIGLGDFWSFRARYAEMGGYEGRQVVGYKNVEELMGLIRPYVFQRTKAETLDLPEKLYARRTVSMTTEQARVYKELDTKTEAEIRDLARDGATVAMRVQQTLAKYNALQQVTGGFVNYDDVDPEGFDVVRRSAWIVEPARNPKIRELVAIAEENEEKPIIVWAKFRNEIEQIVQVLREKFGDDSVVEYHGGISTEQRREGMKRFKAGRSRFFVANQQTGGTGLTINEANVVVYFSNSLRLVDRLQSEDRNHRIGQKNDVLYIDLVCAGTKDVDILRAVRSKKEVADYVKEQMAR